MKILLNINYFKSKYIREPYRQKLSNQINKIKYLLSILNLICPRNRKLFFRYTGECNKFLYYPTQMKEFSMKMYRPADLIYSKKLMCKQLMENPMVKLFSLSFTVKKKNVGWICIIFCWFPTCVNHPHWMIHQVSYYKKKIL